MNINSGNFCIGSTATVLEREKIIGDYIDYEKAIENFEGPAYYSEFMFYKLFSSRPESFKKKITFITIFGYPYENQLFIKKREIVSIDVSDPRKKKGVSLQSPHH